MEAKEIVEILLDTKCRSRMLPLDKVAEMIEAKSKEGAGERFQMANIASGEIRPYITKAHQKALDVIIFIASGKENV